MAKLTAAQVNTKKNTPSSAVLETLGQLSTIETTNGKTPTVTDWGNKWDKVQDQRLITMRVDGSTWYECAAAFKRTPMAVYSRVRTLANNEPKNKRIQSALHAQKVVRASAYDAKRALKLSKHVLAVRKELQSEQRSTSDFIPLVKAKKKTAKKKTVKKTEKKK